MFQPNALKAGLLLKRAESYEKLGDSPDADNCESRMSTAGSFNQDLLYQRWRLVQIQSATGNQVIDATNADWTITEFRSDGTIRYGATGRYTACGLPNRFKRDGNRLDLKNVDSIPLPETDGNCTTVKCAWLGDAWQILSLILRL